MRACLEWVEGIIVWFFSLLDKTGIVRRAYLLATFFMTWQVLGWAMRYAEVNAARPGIEVAAIIGAVSAVVAAVQGFAFKQYLDSRDTP